ncbi:MAG: hypothetical protein AMJ45_01010 [Syntrophobacter sp. DG_60]|nr:MAG: hypothetical protein AMJ45_01010 [Syntrophobacter sp. DG_60]
MKSKRLVSLVKGEDRYQNIYRALEIIKPDLEPLKQKTNILIKPNLLSPENPYANTHVVAIQVIIDFLAENLGDFASKNIVIFEGSAGAYYQKSSTREVFARFGYFALEQNYKNVKLECIENCSEYIPFEIKSIAGSEQARLVKRVRDFDYIISVNLPKTHDYAIATLGIKNMIGLIKQEDKSLIHGLRISSARFKTIFTLIPTWMISWARRRASGAVNLLFRYTPSYRKGVKVIHRNIATLAKLVWPDLVVLDGFYGMEGDGPVDGTPIHLNIAIASTDPLKADALGARIIGFEPEAIGYLYYLAQDELGDPSLDGLVGTPLEEAVVEFKPHSNYKVQCLWR